MAAVVAAVMVINTMIPVLGSSGSSVLSSSGAAAEQIKTDVEIIAVHSVTSSGTSTISLWIKNVGAVEVLAIDLSDVFVQEGNTTFARYSYDPGAAEALTAGEWTYEIQDAATSWIPRATIKVTIEFSGEMGVASRDYIVQFTTNNGIIDEETFSL